MNHETKLFELRDEGTFIIIACIKLQAFPVPIGSANPESAENFLARRAGYRGGAVLLTDANGARKAFVDPHDWGDRTFANAHAFIEENWDELKSGQVIDVEHILGEVDEPKKSERFSTPY